MITKFQLDRVLYQFTHRVSVPALRPLEHPIAARIFHRYMAEQLGHLYQSVDEGPVPPGNIIMRTSILRPQHAATAQSRANYFASGYMQMHRWLALLEHSGFNLRTASTIMELGCGSGRLLRHLRCIKGARLIGTDVEADKIAWCRAYLPGIEFYAHGIEPPITGLDDGTASLIYASSVFTHIPLATQEAWLVELRRILKPDGYLLVSVLNRQYMDEMLTPDQARQVEDNGHFELTWEDDNVSVSSQLTRQWDVFQSRAELNEVFGRHFHLLDFVPSHQDLLVLQKPGPRIS